MMRPQDGSIPSPAEYLGRHGLMEAGTAGGAKLVRCPQHPGEDVAMPTLTICLEDGSFACSACGARGNGVLALHQLVTGMDRRRALRDLQEGDKDE